MSAVRVCVCLRLLCVYFCLSSVCCVVYVLVLLRVCCRARSTRRAGRAATATTTAPSAKSCLAWPTRCCCRARTSSTAYVRRPRRVWSLLSHAQACLRSYEAYARVRSCPLCRRQQYEKRLITDGQDAHRHRCAAKYTPVPAGCCVAVSDAVLRRIQATWRMHRARTHFLSLPPRDPVLRRKWQLRRLEAVGSQAERVVDARSDAIDRLFAELDQTVARTNQLMRMPLIVDWHATRAQARARAGD